MYCVDSQFVSEIAKFVAGSLQALSAMVLLELPHLNVLTKVDLLTPDSKVRSACFWTASKLHSLDCALARHPDTDLECVHEARLGAACFVSHAQQLSISSRFGDGTCAAYLIFWCICRKRWSSF